MNKLVALGRAATEIELRYSSGDEKTAIGSFRIAVPRRKKGETDFINCVAFGSIAENIAKYFHKGDRILIGGRLEVDQYKTKEGKNATAYKVVVEEFDFVEPKKQEEFVEPEEEELPWRL